MAVFEVMCACCGGSFEARSSRAKWCSEACRKRKQRSPDVEPEVSRTGVEPGRSFDADSHQLVASIRAELDRAERLETWQGQQALQVARRLADPDESGIGSLSKELSRLMAVALEGVVEVGAGFEPAPESDEVARARARRDEIAAAAAAAGVEG